MPRKSRSWAASGGLYAGLNDRNIGYGMLGGALSGGLGGAVFGNIGQHYGNSFGPQRILANALAGGALADMSGGNFSHGFFLSGAAAAAMNGWQKALASTDKSSMASGSINRGKNGMLNTLGRRKLEPGYPINKDGYLPLGKGPFEGEINIDTALGRAGNLISKVHDQLNNFRYSKSGRFMPYNTRFQNTLFQVWNISGMILAAIYTGAAFATQQYQPSLTINYGK